MKNKLLEWWIIKSILTLSIPILLSNLLQSAYQLIDAFWVWRLWWDAVAAVWVSFPITFLMISIWSGFSIAWTTLIAQYYWAKKMKMVNHVAAQTISLVVAVSIFISLLWFFSSSYILTLMWVEANVYDNALSFLKISFTWIVFIFWFFMFQSLLRWIGEVKMPMKIVFCTVILNFFLDPLLINGYWFIPGLWVSWAALATLFTQWVACVIWMYFLFKWNYWIKVSLWDFKPDFKYIKQAFALGFPSSVEMSLRSLALVVMTFLITSFWTDAVAWYWAGWNIVQIVVILWLWLSMATTALVWQNIWANNIKRAEKIAKVSFLMAFSFLTFLWIIIFFFSHYFVGFFITWDESVINIWAKFLSIVGLSFGLIWIQMWVNWVLRASWKMNTALMLTIISQWVLQFPIAYVLSKHTWLWLEWIWYAILITNILMTIISLIVFWLGWWKKWKLTKDDILQEKVLEDVILERGLKQ